MTRYRIDFVVVGLAQPKGSAKAFVPLKWAKEAVRQGRPPRAVITQDNPRAKDWQQRVATEAQEVMGQRVFVGPVVLTVTFRLPRPETLPRKTRHHTKRPDLDKLVRTVGDGLQGVVFLDDKQIVDLHARKVYVSGAQPPSVRIIVEAAAPPDPETRDLFADAEPFA